MEKECCICGTTLHTANPRMFWCSNCWKKWKSDILAKKEWCNYLKNNEVQRRQYGSYTKNGKRIYADFVGGLGVDIDVINGKAISLHTENNY